MEEAFEQAEEREDEHLYHSSGWRREQVFTDSTEVEHDFPIGRCSWWIGNVEVAGRHTRRREQGGRTTA
jgi:hypothetical protein